MERVCFLRETDVHVLVAPFESLCKQSSGAATRMTCKMRALQPIDPRPFPPLLSVSEEKIKGAKKKKKEKDNNKRKGKTSRSRPSAPICPIPDACLDPATKIIANNSATNGSDTVGL